MLVGIVVVLVVVDRRKSSIHQWNGRAFGPCRPCIGRETKEVPTTDDKKSFLPHGTTTTTGRATRQYVAKPVTTFVHVSTKSRINTVVVVGVRNAFQQGGHGWTSGDVLVVGGITATTGADDVSQETSHFLFFFFFLLVALTNGGHVRAGVVKTNNSGVFCPVLVATKRPKENSVAGVVSAGSSYVNVEY